MEELCGGFGDAKKLIKRLWEIFYEDNLLPFP